MTEDDYFDYLIGSTRNKNLVPTPVKQALSKAALLFLGFRLEEWDFRVLFRSLYGLGNKNRLSRNYTHVAAQIVPEEGRHIDPAKARRCLQKYFQDAAVSIYWGSVEDFSRDLALRAGKDLPAAPPEVPR